MAINQSILQGQGVGSSIGGVTQAQTQYVQQQVAYQAEMRQQTVANGGGSPGSPGMKPVQDWSSLAWLILGMI